MKTIRLLVITLLCAALPGTANAQENLKKAVDNFVNDKDIAQYIKKSESLENTVKGKKTTVAYYNRYGFEMPASKRKKLGNVLDAFDTDKSTAYKVLVKDAGINSEKLSSVAFGEKLDRTLTLGGFKDRNYRVMFVRDSKDSLRRYMYAIVWYDKADGDSIGGSVSVIYSPDPQRVHKSVTLNVGDTDWNNVIRLNSDGTVTFQDGVTSSNFEPGTDTQTEETITSGTDFIRRLSSLRMTFMSPNMTAKDDIKATLANKILELCSKYGKMLHDEDRDFCIKSIKEMKTRSHDKYIDGLLDLAVSKLDI